MACRKCGSSWKTIYGADRASCPECCKLARHHERAAGRYVDPTQQKTCAACGDLFTAVGLADIKKKKCCSSACQALHRRAGQLASVARRKGVPSKPREKLPRPKCSMCSVEIERPSRGRRKAKYCSPKCFHAARNSGIQAWDRSSIHRAARSRPSNIKQSPDFYQARAGALSQASYLRRLGAFWRRVLKKPARHPVHLASESFARFLKRLPKILTCRRCGEQCVKPARWKLPHCSWACAKKDYTHAKCNHCKRAMKIYFIGGNVEKRKSNPTCNKCVLNRHKKDCGDFRKRCAKFGVPYDPKVTRPAVFERDGFKCHICNKPTLLKYVVKNGRAHPRSPTVDHHPYPLSAGILGHQWNNVRCACLRCNVRKGASWSGQLPLRLGCGKVTG